MGSPFFWLRLCCFQVEESLFEASAAGRGKIADRAVRADYPVARDNQRHRVFRHNRARGAGGLGAMGNLSKVQIGDGLAQGDFPAGQKDLAGKRRKTG